MSPSTLRPYLLLAAIAAALVAALVKKARPRLILYLAAELVTTAVLEWTAKYCDWRSHRYTVTYTIARSVDLLAALFLARPKIVAWPIVAMISWIVWGIMTPTTNAVVAWLTASVFLLAGISLGFRVPFEPGMLTYGPIVALWCFLAIYGYGFAMNRHLFAWEQLNEWWPASVCVVFFTWVAAALLARKERTWET